MTTLIKYSIFVLNFLIFSFYHIQLIGKKDNGVHSFDINDEIRRRINQIFSAAFIDSGFFIIYLLTIFQKLLIPNQYIFQTFTFLFILATIINFKFRESTKYIFVQLINIMTINYFTIGADPLFAFIIRYLNNFLNFIILSILIKYNNKILKEEVTI